MEDNDMQIKRLFTSVLPVALMGSLLIAGTSAVRAATIVQNATITFQNTNWTSSLSFLKFDSSLGTLQSVTLSVDSKVRTIIQLKNTGSTTMSGLTGSDGTGARINTVVQLLVTPTGLPTQFANFQAKQFGPVVLAPNAFAQSDAGFSPPYVNGAPYNDTSQSFALDNTSNQVVGYSSPDFAAFTGAGNIGVNVAANANTTASYSGGNAQIDQLTYANASGTLTYTYQPVPAPPAAVSLGIGSIVGLLGTGVNRLRRRAKRK